MKFGNGIYKEDYDLVEMWVDDGKTYFLCMSSAGEYLVGYYPWVR